MVNKASKGGKVTEKDNENLTENLMRQLIQLDGIVADGDLKQQRRIQVITFGNALNFKFTFAESL